MVHKLQRISSGKMRMLNVVFMSTNCLKDFCYSLYGKVGINRISAVKPPRGGIISFLGLLTKGLLKKGGGGLYFKLFISYGKNKIVKWAF